MKVIQIYENLNTEQSFNDYSEFFILMMLSSVTLWNRHNKTKPDLYCDLITLDLLEKLNVTHLWASINTDILSKPTSINKQNFWARAKQEVMATIDEPFILFDVDLLPYCNLEELVNNSTEDVIYSHEEDAVNYEYTKESPEVKMLSNYPLFKTWSTKSLNSSFLAFKNMELKNKYVSLATQVMNELNEKIKVRNYGLLTFMEQKVFKEFLLNNPKYTRKTLIKEYFKDSEDIWSETLNSDNYFWDYKESTNKFKHYGPKKPKFVNDSSEINFLNRILYNNFGKFNLSKLLKNIKILWSENINPHIYLFKYFIDKTDSTKLFNYIFLDKKRKKYISQLINNDVDINIDENKSYILNFSNSNDISFIGLQFLVKNAHFNELKNTEYTKQYHYKVSDSIYNEDFSKNNLLNRFSLKDFFDFYHISTNYFEFEYTDNKKYYLISNEEFVVDFEYYHDDISCNVYFKNNTKYDVIICSEDNFKHYKNKITRRNILIPKPSVITYDILDYYIFGGIRFSDTHNIQEYTDFIKKDIKNLFNGLNYYFCGSSLFKNNAKDMDIYVGDEASYISIEGILNNHTEYSQIERTDNTIRYLHNKSKTKLDIIKECVTYSIENNELSLRDLYLDLCHAYVNTAYSNGSDFRKKYRYNKILELYDTQKFSTKVSAWNHSNFDYYENIVANFDNYYNLINDSQYDDIAITHTNSCICKLLYKNSFYYLIVKPKVRKTDRFKINIPFLICDIEILTNDNISRDILFIKNNETTDIEINIIHKYCLLKFKKNE